MLTFKMGISQLVMLLLLCCTQWTTINADLSTMEVIRLCTGKHGSLIAYPGDQNKFIVCMGEDTQVASCREETLADGTKKPTCFDVTEQKCHSEICTQGGGGSTASEYEKFVTTYCQAEGLWLVQIPAEDCEHYYVCFGPDNKPLYKSCPQDMHYSREKKDCVNQLEASCQQLTELCTDKKTGYRFPSTNCFDYYECIRSKPFARSCDYNEHFDKASKKCIPASNSQCVETNHRAPKCKPEDNGLYFPHPTCNKFYVCVNTVALEAQCSDDYYFDEKAALCKKDTKNTCAK